MPAPHHRGMHASVHVSWPTGHDLGLFAGAHLLAYFTCAFVSVKETLTICFYTCSPFRFLELQKVSMWSNVFCHFFVQVILSWKRQRHSERQKFFPLFCQRKNGVSGHLYGGQGCPLKPPSRGHIKGVNPLTFPYGPSCVNRCNPFKGEATKKGGG